MSLISEAEELQGRITLVLASMKRLLEDYQSSTILLDEFQRSMKEGLEMSKYSISDFSLKIQSIPGQQQALFRASLKSLRAERERLQTEYDKVIGSGLKGKSGRTGPYSDDPFADDLESQSTTNASKYQDQRQQALRNKKMLDRQNQQLIESERRAREQVSYNANTLDILGQQTEQIEGTIGRLTRSDWNVDRSMGTIRQMARQMATNRIVSIAIICVLVLLIIAVIYNKFR